MLSIPTNLRPGATIEIAEGKQIIRNGVPDRQKRRAVVTIKRAAPDRRGKVRIFWKSRGYTNSALV